MPIQQSLDAQHSRYTQVFPYFLRVFIPFSVLLILVIAIYSVVEGWYAKKIIKGEQLQQVELSQQSLVSDISGVIHELKYLAEAIKPFTESSGLLRRHDAEKIVRSFASHIQRYDQIRWLNEKGMEVLRVDYRGGSARVVPQNELQDKSSRYYFIDAIKLPPGSIYTSPLDLNVEHGEVEVPHRPMLRIAMPTTDASGVRNGVIILNYQAARMLEHFERSKRVGLDKLYLLDANSFWLSASDDSPVWNFMFDKKENFMRHFPDIWHAISEGNEGSIESEKGIFTFLPVRDSVFDISGESSLQNYVGEEYDALARQGVKWIILAYNSRDAIRGIYLKHAASYGLVLMAGLLMLGIFSWKRGRFILERNNLIDRLALHAKVMETATNGVMITDAEPKVIAVNSAFSKVTGYSEEEVVGKNPSILSSGRHDSDFYKEMWGSLALRGYWEGEIWNRHKNGEVFPEWMSISAIDDHEGNLSNYIGIFSVLAEQQGTEERLRELANTDMLTGLINRNLFYDRAGQALAYCRRTEIHAAILFLDLDGFKPINDTIGHAAGDEVLREVARRLAGCLRETDTVARFGGDEFLLLLSGFESREVLTGLATKILERINEPVTIGDVQCQVGASIGICLYPDDAATVDELIRCADQAMYKAKENGKGQFAFYH